MGAYPHHDDGVAVLRILHKEHSVTIGNVNGQFESIFDVHGPVPTYGQVATARWVLTAILAYQLSLLYRHHVGLPPHQVHAVSPCGLAFMTSRQLFDAPG